MLTEIETLSVMHGMCHGLAFIQARGLVHRDIKPHVSPRYPRAFHTFSDTIKNVLVFNTKPLFVKLCDFGLVHEVGEIPAVVSLSFYIITIIMMQSISKMKAGTPGYMAPEIESGMGPCTSKVDMWGAGCVLFNM